MQSLFKLAVMLSNDHKIYRVHPHMACTISMHQNKVETGHVYPRATAHYVELFVFHSMRTKQSHHSYDAQIWKHNMEKTLTMTIQKPYLVT